MKSVLFVVCFAVGVSLMIFSGYLPQSASARGNDADGPGSLRGFSLLPDGVGRTVTRKALTGLPPGPETADPTMPGPEAYEHQDQYEDYADVGAADRAVPAEAGLHDLPEPTLGEQSGGLAQESAGPPEWAPFASEPIPATAAPEPPVSSPPALAPPTELTPLPAATDPPAPEAAPLFADAGPDRVVWVGWNEVTLDGSASMGAGLSYRWRQVGGPTDLTIQDARRAVTTAAGLLTDDEPKWRPDLYKIELTVTDMYGAQDADTIEVVAKRAPTLRVKPAAERRFEIRDGYPLGHYVSWVTNLETYEAVFEISSDQELNFHKVGGGAYEPLGGKVEHGFVYQVIVYPLGNETSSWVEFLVDTEEKVPGIVQLGVNWEAR